MAIQPPGSSLEPPRRGGRRRRLAADGVLPPVAGSANPTAAGDGLAK